MKICIITSLYKPCSKGGAEIVVEDIVNGLAGKGHEVLVVTAGLNFMHGKIPLTPPFGKLRAGHSHQKFGVVAGSLRKGETNVIRFYPWNLFWFGDIDKKPIWLRLPWHIIDVFNAYSYFKIKKILTKEKPDIVMTHNLKGIGYTVPAAIRACNIKHIHTVHDVQLVEPSGLSYQKNKKAKKQKSTSSRRSLSCLRRQAQRTAAFIELATGVTARAGRLKGECGTPLKILYAWITKKLFGSPEIVVSPSQWLLDFYTERGFFKKSKKMVLRNPLSSKGGALIPLLKKERQGEVNNNLNILYIGQIEDHKGILFLANAVKKLISPSFAGCLKSVIPSGVPLQSSAEGRSRGIPLARERLILAKEIPPLPLDSLRSLGVGRDDKTTFLDSLFEEGAGGGYCIHLDIIGTGTAIDKLKEYSKNCDRIKIHGFIENREVNKFIVQSDFVAVPSLCAENAPKVIYESFACGVPVIASDVGGIPELVKNGYNGYVFEAGNEESFKKTLQKCIEEKDRWDEFGENALKSIEGWGIDEYVEKLMLRN